jgi:hypothetical protein
MKEKHHFITQRGGQEIEKDWGWGEGLRSVVKMRTLISHARCDSPEDITLIL